MLRQRSVLGPCRVFAVQHRSLRNPFSRTSLGVPGGQLLPIGDRDIACRRIARQQPSLLTIKRDILKGIRIAAPP